MKCHVVDEDKEVSEKNNESKFKAKAKTSKKVTRSMQETEE
jgi:hypothetical protein